MNLTSLSRWCGHEARMQIKNGMYPVYIIVNLIYIFALGYVPADWKETITILLVLSDPTFLGMIFVGGILLLERNNGIPKGIGISPIGSGGYVLAKCISLLIIVLVTTICIMSAGGIRITVYKIIGVLLAAAVFTMGGMIISTYSKSLNHFIGLFMGATVFGVLPIVVYCFKPSCMWLSWLPAYPLLRVLIQDGWKITADSLTLTKSGNLICIMVLLCWCIMTYYATKLVVERRLFQ